MLAAGMFAFIYFVERRIQPPAPVASRIWTGTKDGVTAIEISPKGQTAIRLERTNGVWQMTQPVVYPVQAYAVDKFLQALAALEPTDRITGQELQSNKNVSKEYGFETPGYSILIEQGDDKFQLYLGKPTAPGDGIYTQRVGYDDVNVISIDFLKYLPTDADDWRDKTFVKLEDLTFDRLTVTNSGSGGTTLRFMRGASNSLWTMTYPTASPAASGEIESLLKQIRNTRVTHFVAENAALNLAALGLQPPQLELALADGTNQVLDLQFGKSTNDDEYARVGAQGPVLRITRGNLDDWRQGPNAFRDSNLVSRPNLMQDLLQGFSIDVIGPDGGTNFVVRWTNNAIFMMDAEQHVYPVDLDKLREFLTNLLSMQIAAPDASNPQSFAAKDIVRAADLGTYGLADTNVFRRYALTATPSNSAPTLLAQLDFGFANAKAPGTMFVRRAHIADDQAVYAVKTSDFEKLPAKALDLFERRIWPHFEADDVETMTIKSNGLTRILERKGPSVWPPAPVPGNVGISDPGKEMSTEILVGNLGDLEAQSWVGPAGPDLAKYGFDEKSAWIELKLRNGQIRRFDLGGPAPGGRRYASTMLGSQRWIFVYAANDWKNLNDWIWWPEP